MKSAKNLIVFSFLLAFALGVSAQTNQYPNEIESLQFFKSGRLDSLKILASDKNAVMAVFGEECEHGCDYNEDWKISFSYVNSGWSKTMVENDKKLIYRPKPELVGKLAGISFKPRKQVLLPESVVIPKEFNCGNGISYGDIIYQVRICADDKRVVYAISNESIEDKKLVKGQVMTIDYLPTKKENDEIFVLVDK